MDPPITLNLDKNCKLTDIKNKVIDVFNKTKNDNVQLVFVVIPEFPPGIYGIEFIYSSLYFNML